MAINPLIRTALAEILHDHMRGVAQKAVAKAWRISPKAVSDYVNEVSNAGPKNFAKLAENMANVPPETFARMLIDRLHEVSRRELTTNDKGEVVVASSSPDETPLYVRAPPEVDQVAEPRPDLSRWHEEPSLTSASRDLASAFAHFVETLATDMVARTRQPNDP